jgi:hypothetical protein
MTATGATAVRIRLLLLVTLLGARVASADPLQAVTVFQSGTNGYNTFRIPAIITAKNGDLLAFAEGRKNSSSDTGDIDLVMRRSTDGGLTWGALQVVLNDGVNTAGNPSPVVDQATGNIILLSTHNLGQDTLTEIQNGTSAGTRTVWAQRSTDNGATWSTATEITSSVKSPDWRWYATGPCHAIQLQRGPHAGRLIAGANESGPTSNGALAIYSDDGGVTWTRGVVVESGATFPSETALVELTDGRINMNSRNRGGTTRSRATAYSSNSGQTFSNIGVAPALIDPQVQGSILRYSAVDQGGAQNRILFSNPADPTSRVRMTVRSSFDETATWNAGKIIDRGPSAYSDLVAYGSGQAGVLYEQGNYNKINFAGWGTSWLDDPTVVQLDFNEKPSGTASATAGAMRDGRGYGLNGTAEGAPTYVSGDPRYGSSPALRFAAGSDLVRIGEPANQILDFEADDSFTLEAVFRTTAHGGTSANESGPLISKDVGSLEPSYWLRVDAGKVQFLVSDGTSEPNLSSPVTVNDGQWHHVAAERDAALGQLRLYVDYALVGTVNDTTTGGFGNANDLLVGAFNNAIAGTKQFVGDIDFVRVSAGALPTSGFIQPVPEPAAGMLLAAGILPALLKRNRKGRWSVR